MALVGMSTGFGIAPGTARADDYVGVERGEAYERLLLSPDPVQRALAATPGWVLIGTTPDGRPAFLQDHNEVSAATIRTNELWPGGGSGFDATGATAGAGVIGVFENGRALTSHDEFGGRVTEAHPPTTPISNHATHVTGTILASGVVSGARGMSYEARATLYPTSDALSGCADHCVMSGPAGDGMLVSNHSYGRALGWSGIYDPDAGETTWYWLGSSGLSYDDGFGAYTELSESWDQLAWTYLGYSIVKSAGNDRNDTGPSDGEGHYHWDSASESWIWAFDYHQPDGDWDTLGPRGVAKNAITVGAVEDIPLGWTSESDVVLAAFSSSGPTDDGRIKPDLVANGVDLYSPVSEANDAYDSYSGTSMSAPSVVGSLNLLREIFEAEHSYVPKASTLKALAIHTADEAGNEGPDYTFGWGLMNARAAADLIAGHGALTPRIVEGDVAWHGPDYEPEIFRVAHSGGDFQVTLVWTDVPGDPGPGPRLKNDLDLRLTSLDGAVYLPWILDPTSPEAPATRGDNTVDNVEQIRIEGLPAGDYDVTITHKGLVGTLNPQTYSLILSSSHEVPLPELTIETLPGLGGDVFPRTVAIEDGTLWVAGQAHDGTAWRPIYWQSPLVDGSWTTVTLPNGFGDARVNDMDIGEGDSLFVGDEVQAGGRTKPVIWNVGPDEALQSYLPALSNRSSSANAVALSPSGDEIVVGWSIRSSAVRKAVIWQKEGDDYEVFQLPDLGAGFAATATDVVSDEDGILVCGVVETSEGDRAAKWVLGLEGWLLEVMHLPPELLRAAALSIVDGNGGGVWINGWGETADGERVGIVWKRDVPEIQPTLAGYDGAEIAAGARRNGASLVVGRSFDALGGEATFWSRSSSGTNLVGSLGDVVSADMAGLQLQTAAAVALGEGISIESWEFAAVGSAIQVGGIDESPAVGYVVVARPEVSSAEPNFELAGSDRLQLSVGPNPIRADSQVRLQIGNESRVRLELFDAVGRRVLVFSDEQMEPGEHLFDLGELSKIPSGVLFLRGSTSSSSQTLKLIRVR